MERSFCHHFCNLFYIPLPDWQSRSDSLPFVGCLSLPFAAFRWLSLAFALARCLFLACLSIAVYPLLSIRCCLLSKLLSIPATLFPLSAAISNLLSGLHAVRQWQSTPKKVKREKANWHFGLNSSLWSVCSTNLAGFGTNQCLDHIAHLTRSTDSHHLVDRFVHKFQTLSTSAFKSESHHNNKKLSNLQWNGQEKTLCDSHHIVAR